MNTLVWALSVSAIAVSIAAVWLQCANLRHYQKTEKEILRQRDAAGQTGAGDLW